MNKFLKILFICLSASSISLAQTEESPYTNVSTAQRTIAPSYRITEYPSVIDTVIPIPNIEYPLLKRNMQTEISLEQIDATKIKIIDKLDKLYPAYIRLGLGNYASTLGELYYNSLRNRRLNYGVHLNHKSSFGNIKNQAPSTYDLTTGKVFAEYFSKYYLFESEFDYLNHGYHFYGLEDTLGTIPKDSLKNRVQGFKGTFKFSNFTTKDSANLLYKIKLSYQYFHDFKSVWDSTGLNARNGNLMLGTELSYKLKNNVFALDFDFNYNNYKYGENDASLPIEYRRNDENVLVHFRPTVSSYGDKWKVVFGADINFDVPSTKQFKVIPVLEGKYSFFKDIFITYAGVTGGVKQNTYYNLNRQNEFMMSSVDLKNTKELKAYGGIKGTLSEKISFNVQGYYKIITDLPLYFNDTVFSDLYRFTLVYDDINITGFSGSFSYQLAEKLKIDAIGEYNIYKTTNEEFAWYLPEMVLTLRTNYNLYDKIYIKADISMEGGRKSPIYMYNQGPNDTPVYLGFLADANLHMEYRYNSRFSAFLQFNNLAAQRYKRWYKYPVQGFQLMGGITFGF